jgi:phospholipid/cholesterol/gamma-HCH transport system substrate-binding protein
MSNPHITERYVGIFVFIGIIATATLILQFGKVGDRFRGGYPITVEFSNAGGLIKGAQVLYAGVLVGKVDSIKLDSKEGGVDVMVNLFEGVQIRNDATFIIKQSGLLGDQNLVIVARSNTAPLFKASDKVRGIDPFDFSEVANQAGDAIKKLNTAIEKLSTDVLNKETIENLKEGIKNLVGLTQKLETTSDRVNAILGDARKGKGTVGKLITDEQLFEELKRLIHNWRVHGLLYREKASERYPTSPKETNTRDNSKD